MSRLLTWKEMTLAGMIVEPGNSQQYSTGGWRTYKPVHAKQRCISCLRCWILCPDSAVLVRVTPSNPDGEMAGFDYDHCKGCGICAKECPEKCQAIEMTLDT